jgi:cyclopropane fatty-acyl-phospholipid synthase-like methyltransferase
MTSELPFSQACENNKDPILSVLQDTIANKESLLEIAGGTGQHAVYFAGHFPELHWQSSDIPDNVDTLNLRLIDAGLHNLPRALSLDVNQSDWACDRVDAIFSANSLHIMSTASVENFFRGVGRTLHKGGLLLVYGPFKYGNRFTTESNAQFDRWLKARDPASGVRDFEWIDSLARAQNLQLLKDHAMPANNQLLVWKEIG